MRRPNVSHTLLLILFALAACGDGNSKPNDARSSDGARPGSDAAVAPGAPVVEHAQAMIAAGRQTFRFDTFGDEAFWGGQLQMHLGIAGAANGGVGPGVAPMQALALGLKVDMDALPAAVVTGIQNNTISLTDPATPVALLKLHAVVGVPGVFDSGGKLTSVGIQCALCHSTVADAFAPGVGHRLAGWATRDLHVGAIDAGTAQTDQPVLASCATAGVPLT